MTTLALPTQLFLNGACRDAASGRHAALINPATEEPFVEVAAADAADVDTAVDSAQRAWETGWRDLAPGKRTEILFSVARRLRDHIEEIAQLETLHIGKPIGDARDEAALGARVFEYYAGAISQFCGRTIPVARGGFDFTLRQPMGVVAAIVPWNFPFPIACWTGARSRVFVERGIYELFVEQFVAATKKLIVGDPAKAETQLGPLVSSGQRATVEEFLADARKRGSRFACGGGRPHAKGYYLEPTVL